MLKKYIKNLHRKFSNVDFLQLILVLIIKLNASWSNLFGQYPRFRLMRFHSPIPIVLLFAPLFWTICCATNVPILRCYYTAVFFVAAILARSIGCVINDIVDCKIDKQCIRSKNRPLVTGECSVIDAWKITALLAVGMLLIACILPIYAALVGICIAPLIIAYPFAKRFSRYPQIFLGLIFNLGVWVVWFSIRDSLNFIPFLIYFSSAMWTIGYDTLYAHQDYDDDIKNELGSFAVSAGESLPYVVSFLYRLAFLGLAIAGINQGVGWSFYIIFLSAGYILYWQIENFDFANKDRSGELFFSNILFAIISSIGFYMC